MLETEIAIIQGTNFLVTNQLGDVAAGTQHGYFVADTRFLSEFTFELTDCPLELLTSGQTATDAARFYLTNRATTALPERAITIVRDRLIREGLQETISLQNHLAMPIEVTIVFQLDADFADVFEVRGHQALKQGTVTVEQCEGCSLAFHYRRDGFERYSLVRSTPAAQVDGRRLVYTVGLGPHEAFDACVEVFPESEPQAARLGPACQILDTPIAALPRLLGEPFRAPSLATDDHTLFYAYQRSIDDLSALRLRTEGAYTLPAAGLPWYMAIFGRDSLITAYQTVFLNPELARGALYALRAYQGRTVDPFRDEAPGKIPHEVRRGELAVVGEVPHATYYGSADATPLYLVLLGETYRWTGDLDLIWELLPAAEAALRWIDRYGDADRDGFVEYETHSPRGLRNQGWKDSPDSVRFAGGEIAEPPIALCEVQGYVYDAKLRMAEIYDAIGESPRAAGLRAQAADLKKRFQEAFWMPAEGFYAMALDRRKRQVNAIASNPGHCLWSGIVDERHARAVAERLMAPDLFSGWGIRTLSTQMVGYNPVSYHNGSIWPFDNSLIAAGLLRYGFRDAAGRVARSIVDAAGYFPSYRLPELYAGFERRFPGFPVRYPTANAPQAWSAGAIGLLLRVLLDLRPGPHDVETHPLPSAPRITLIGVPFRGEKRNVAPPRG
ncbi:MAG: amylo-alpha-1,6-glucosidase [Chloroflexi bacterium]|nr:amylo-alpha-1,6-glucosidase [Chloroflexota bacterium]